MKILVTGSNGQLGSEIKALASRFPSYDFTFTDVAELDITSEKAVEAMAVAEKPDVLINCAAYTAVDKAEQEFDLALKINSDAAGILSRVALRHNTLLIHISTDYVFDGKNHRPYSEDDPVNPASAYGRTKLAGEEQVRMFAGNALIIRTSWLYSEFGHNFIKTIMKYGKERGALKVVFDQTGSPTWAHDLALAILQILHHKDSVQGVETYHYSNEGVASWYDFALAITEFAGIPCKISPIETKDYPLPATRPEYSVFNKAKIKQRFGLTVPYWRDSLRNCIGHLVDGAEK